MCKDRAASREWDRDTGDVLGFLDPGGLVFPTSLGVSNSGEIFVSDFKFNRGTRSAHLAKYDPETGEPLIVATPDLFGPFGVAISATSLPGHRVRTYEYAVSAIDADDDDIKYSMVSAPDGMVISSGSGLISWAPTADQIGNHDVVVEASDGRGGTASQKFVVCVHADPENHDPVIVSVPVTTFATDSFSEYQYDVDAVDPNTDEIVYSLVEGPVGMEIDPDTGMVRWPLTEMLGNNLVVNGGAESGDTTGWTTTGVEAINPETAPPFVTWAPIPSGSHYFWVGHGAATVQELHQSIDLSGLDELIDQERVTGPFGY